MSNILEDLVNQIQKSEPSRPVQQRRRAPQQQSRRGNSLVKSAGPGGIVFDFGAATGDPWADHFSALLNRHADPAQAQIARDQKRQYQKSLGEFVDVGEAEYDRRHCDTGCSDTVQKAWNEQFAGSVDEKIKQLHAEGNLEIDNPHSIEKSGPVQSYGQSSIRLESGENVKATSETDQAVIEMMKSAQLPDAEE